MPDAKPVKKSGRGPLIFRIVIILIAGLTVGLSVFSWNAQKLIGNQMPMPFGFGASVILSGSMEPTLSVNDLVFVIEQDSYQADDIVVYQEGTMLIIHRIISVDGDTVITKGDANNVADDPITLDRIKGKLAFRIPYIGFIFKMIKTVPGTLIVLFLAVFLMYRSRRREKDRDIAEMDKIVEEIRRLQEQQAASAALTPAVADDPALPPTPLAEPEPAPVENAAPADGDEELTDVRAMLNDMSE